MVINECVFRQFFKPGSIQINKLAFFSFFFDPTLNSHRRVKYKRRRSYDLFTVIIHYVPSGRGTFLGTPLNLTVNAGRRLVGK